MDDTAAQVMTGIAMRLSVAYITIATNQLAYWLKRVRQDYMRLETDRKETTEGESDFTILHYR